MGCNDYFVLPRTINRRFRVTAGLNIMAPFSSKSKGSNTVRSRGKYTYFGATVRVRDGRKQKTERRRSRVKITTTPWQKGIRVVTSSRKQISADGNALPPRSRPVHRASFTARTRNDKKYVRDVCVRMEEEENSVRAGRRKIGRTKNTIRP